MKINKTTIITITVLFLLFVVPITAYLKYTSRQQDYVALDDVHPLISCQKELIEQSDILFVIPFYQNTKLTDFPEWCEEIKNSGKEVGLHGFTHAWQELGTDYPKEYFEEAIDEFEACFGEKPTKARPPMWKLSEKNKKILEELNMEIMNNPLQTNTYHCDDRGFIFGIISVGE